MQCFFGLGDLFNDGRTKLLELRNETTYNESESDPYVDNPLSSLTVNGPLLSAVMLRIQAQKEEEMSMYMERINIIEKLKTE
jgi:hypothetical protein